MTKSELIAQIAENAGITKSDADKAYDAIVSAIMSGLKKDGHVPMTGLGTFFNWSGDPYTCKECSQVQSL